MEKHTPEDLVLFLGAGASMPFGIPGMRRFIEKLNSDIKSDKISLGNDGKELWAKLLDIADQENVEIDLEWILSILNDLSRHNLRLMAKLFDPQPDDDELGQIRNSANGLKTKTEEYIKRECQLPTDRRDAAVKYYNGFLLNPLIRF